MVGVALSVLIIFLISLIDLIAFILKYERPVVNSNGNTACLATIQIDVESTQDVIEQYGKKRQKYNIVATDKDGNESHPIILHNSPSGAIERVAAQSPCKSDQTPDLLREPV